MIMIKENSSRRCGNWQKGNVWSCSNKKEFNDFQQKEFNDFRMFPGVAIGKSVVSLARPSSLFLGITHPITMTHSFPKQNYHSCRNIRAFFFLIRKKKTLNLRSTPCKRFVLTNIKD